MESVAFASCLLFLMLGPAFPMCQPARFTMYVEKPECEFCVAINTTICMGFCYTTDSNMKELLGPRFLIQRGCTYNKVEYRTAVLPGCPVNSDPLFTYPVALSCHCGACRTDREECVHRARTNRPNCYKPIRDAVSYPPNYMTPF
ncbi:thyroid stimulating hormone subunit beta a [Synchiropus splendidus]|uniref:thyroid stimulating hormone subunit beta a n=1 Tax=Synchiropus splendidus TaxID=270530 RepID=UPI00237D3DDE|nr:thyroid stimulating hormone subunit beta a [Synchiropus splendidus]